MTPLLTCLAVAVAAPATPAVSTVHTNTESIRELQWDDQGVLWAATGGGLEAWSAEGQRLALVNQGLPGTSLLSVGLYEGAVTVGTESMGAARWDGQDWVVVHGGRENLDGAVVAVLEESLVTRGGRLLPDDLSVEGTVGDAVIFRDELWVGTREGALVNVDTDRVLEPGCPVVDLAVGDDGLRVACLVTSYLFDGETLERQPWPATAVTEDAWGTLDGRVIDEQGVIGHVPGRITALEAIPGGWGVGTEQGLYLLAEDLQRLTPEGQICGNFVTGAAELHGELWVGTFDGGACRFDGERWHALQGLPSQLVNELSVYEDALWIATSEGLVRYDGELELIPVWTDWKRFRGPAGTHHATVNDMAVAGERLWIADLVGPISVVDGLWRRRRLAVFGTSYQAIAACGRQAWIGSEDAGLSHYDGRSWTHHDVGSGLPEDWVMALSCEGGIAWAGTYQSGVARWDGRSWEPVEGLPEDWILALAKAEEGLWVGTMGGLFLLEEGLASPIWTPDPRVHELVLTEQAVLIGTEGGLLVKPR